MILPRAGTDERAAARFEERPDRLVHALAQLSDEVTLELPARHFARPQLDLLASAYGVEDRIHFSSSPPGRPGGREVRSSTMAELVESLATGSSPASTRRGSDTLLEGHRVGVVTNIPTHYRIPLFTGVGDRLGAAGASFRVFFTGSAPPEKTYMRTGPLTFDHEFMPTRRAPLGIGDVPPALERRLRRFEPTILISAGFAPPVSGRLARFASSRKLAFGIWSGEVPWATTAASRFRHSQRRWILRRANFGIAYGSVSAEYLRQLAPDLPVVYGRNTAAIENRPDRMGVSGRTEVLTVGRAVRGKGLEVLIDAFGLLTDLSCRLTVVGGGPELARLEERARGQDNVRFLGAVPSDRVHSAYREADVFAFPTRFDVFGLVLVEALGAGRATIVSTAAGAVADLCVAGQNSLVLETHSAGEWEGAIRRLAEDPGLRLALATAGRRTVASRWTMEHAIDSWTAGMRLGVLTTTGQGRPT